MSTTSYAGIDYGLGQSNIDHATGIRYGVIAQNSINLDILSEFESEYGEPHCPKCGNEIKASDDPALFADSPDDNGTESDDTPDWFDGKDYTCVACQECYWSDSCFPDEALGISYEADGYKITDCLDTDLFVLASPYFTYAQFCSPCVPGACNLDSPLDVTMTTGEWTVENELAAQAHGRNRCFALGHDWFDEGKAPYRVWRVSDNSEVLPEVK